MKVVRILIYEGGEERVKQVLKQSLADGNWDFGGIVTSAVTLPVSTDFSVRKDTPPFDKIRSCTEEDTNAKVS